MKSIKKISFSLEDCLSKIYEIATQCDIRIEKGINDSHTPLVLYDDNDSKGLIRVYESKKGITLDGTMKDVQLNEKILDMFYNLYCGQYESKLIPSVTTYTVPKSKFDIVRDLILKISNLDSIIEDGRNSTYYIMKVSSNDKKIITISQYNSGKLLIQGKNWDIWNEICSEIERELNFSTNEILARYMSNQNEDVQNIITSSLVSNAENTIKKRMGRVFDFLYDHDKKLIISSQAQFDAHVIYGSYMCYIAPTLLVIEGYFKKILVEIQVCTDVDYLELNNNNKPKFNFGKIFDNSNNTLKPCYKSQLTGNTLDKENALLEIYDKYQWNRSALLHNNPPPIHEINTYDDAESIFDEIVNMIINTYNVLC